MIDSYDKIRSVQVALTNVSLAREWLARVLRLRHEVKELKKILKAEREFFTEEEEEEKEQKKKEEKKKEKQKQKDKKKKKKKKKDESSSEEEESEGESDEELEEDKFDATEYGLDEILVFDPENEESLLLEVHDRIHQLETFRSSVFAEVSIFYFIVFVVFNL
jgi:Sec-independent protein translocase protein TatA